MAYGSLAMLGGVDAAEARVRKAAAHAHAVLAPHRGRVHDTLQAHHSSNHLTSYKPSYSPFKDTSDSYLDRLDRFDNNAPSHKMLAFLHTHTGDQLNLTYFEKGRYIKDALHEINHLLRDYHDGTVHPIDPALLDQLYDLKHALGIRKPFHIVSAYRSPATNADLRKHSDGVAKNSLHMEGRAIDIRVEGMSTRLIKEAALNMRRGGVGYYHRSDFVHLDTGSVRNWAG